LLILVLTQIAHKKSNQRSMPSVASPSPQAHVSMEKLGQNNPATNETRDEQNAQRHQRPFLPFFHRSKDVVKAMSVEMKKMQRHQNN
jgi:hypothetical protein